MMQNQQKYEKIPEQVLVPQNWQALEFELSILCALRERVIT